MERRMLLAAACTLALAGCATGSGSSGGAASKGDFTPTGAVSGFTGNASFDATRVVGPKVNATLGSDGVWGGSLGDRPLFHTFKDGTLSGPDLTIAISKAGGVLTITGQVQGRILRFEVSPTVLRVRTDTRSMDFGGDGNGVYSGAKTVTFTGDAIALPPTVPFALALAATFM
jgi:hypothetical protein